MTGMSDNRSRFKIIDAYSLFNARIAANPCLSRTDKRVFSLELR